METREFTHRSYIHAPAEFVFDWHTRPGAIERLTPPWQPMELVERQGGVEDGARVIFDMVFGPFRKRWVAEHRDFERGIHFRDVQVKGPFAHWDHSHRIVPEGPGSCMLVDHIRYALPGGNVGNWLGAGFVKSTLKAAFDYRHRILHQDLAAHLSRRGATAMNILVTGSTGMVGSALVPFLTTGGHQVKRLTHGNREGAEWIRWDPRQGQLDAASLQGLDVVIHLAGENIAGGRWSDERKQRIRDSRVKGTSLLCEKLAGLDQPPKVIVSASAIGFYGPRGSEKLDEDSPAGTGFLAEVCKEWEDACAPARDKGIRVVNARLGVVLSPNGGALAKMLLPFKMGVGGVVGSGQQYMSWIALDDVVGGLHQVVVTETLRGPVNLVAPNAATNHQFTKALGKVLGRPTILPMPAFMARLAFGEMADELLLTGQHVTPKKLLESDYAFRYPDLEGALRHLLGRPLAA